MMDRREEAQQRVRDFIPWAVKHGLPPRVPRGEGGNLERMIIWTRLYSEWSRLRREGKL